MSGAPDAGGVVVFKRGAQRAVRKAIWMEVQVMAGRIALIPGEQIVMSSDLDRLVLTTRRVRYDSVVLGSSRLISMTLTSVASCGLTTRSFPLLLLLAVGALLYGLSQRSGDLEVFVGAFIVLLIAYFSSRRAMLSIASDGGQSIMVPARSMKRDAILEFIEAVETQKLACETPSA